MAQPTKPAKLHLVAHKRLQELQTALRREGLPKVEATDLLSALVIYTPAPQAAILLSAYWRYTKELDAATEDDP